MKVQDVFRRYELKYMLTVEEKEIILRAMERYMSPDKYGRSVIRNIYFDTDTYRLIRRSNEKPAYKEKLRIRSYCKVKDRDPVFAELKKKYRQVVYKRRILLPGDEAMKWLSGGECRRPSGQIADEIDYFIEYYRTLRPTVFLSYDREAYFSNDSSDFRVTFDDTILCRLSDLSLKSEVYGTPILPPDKVLMEIKCSGGIPMWMVSALSGNRIYRTSFSKYGSAYNTLIFPKLQTKASIKLPEVIQNA